MTDENEIRRKQQAQSREFPETMAVFDQVRSALAEALFRTKLSDKDAREDIYTRVQALDAMKQEMTRLLNEGAGSEAIKAYVEELEKKATTGK